MIKFWNTYVHVRKPETRFTLFNVEVSPEFRLCIGYRHSLEKTDILEIFRVEKRSLILDSVVCESFYPGSGDRFSPAMCTITRVGNKMVVKGMADPLRCLYLRVGEFADHYLLFNGRKVCLLEWAKPGEKLEIRVVRKLSVSMI